MKKVTHIFHLALALWFAAGLTAHVVFEHGHCDDWALVALADSEVSHFEPPCCATQACGSTSSSHHHANDHSHHSEARQLSSTRDALSAPTLASATSTADVVEYGLQPPPVPVDIPPPIAYLSHTRGLRAPPAA